MRNNLYVINGQLYMAESLQEALELHSVRV